MDILIIILLALILIEVSYLAVRSSGITHTSRRGAVFIDTSALMDGRIVTAAQSGFIPNKLIVPKSVINEMHMLADLADPDKRLRARRGLEAISELQEAESVSMTILDDGQTGDGGVDERLVELAKKHSGSICTIDFNLNKAATAQGITVLNINELAGSIRMAFLPGESFKLPLTQKGQEQSQAVGYLPDGTMVVVDKATSHMGQTVEVEVIRSLQTAAGRMIFAKLPKDSKRSPDKTNAVPKAATGRQPKAILQPKSNARRVKNSNPRSSSRKNVEDSLIDLVNNQ